MPTVTLNFTDTQFPLDGNPISLTGVNKIEITNINTKHASLVMQVISLNSSIHGYELTTGNTLIVDNPYPRDLVGLFFIITNNPNKEVVSFDYELTY